MSNNNDNDNDIEFLNSIILKTKEKKKNNNNNNADKSPINNYFDHVFCLNLTKRTDRLNTIDKRFQFIDLKYERFAAIDGTVLPHIHQKLKNPYFSNSAYVGCCISHLSIYQLALDRGYSNILIIEDDNRVHRNAQEIFKSSISEIENESVDLIHFAYIPLTDDLSMWSYGILSDELKVSKHFYKSKNLWSLMAYGISSKLMKYLLEVYKNTFPMELDRYFVDHVMKNPEFKCRAITPQLFCAEDNYSDNTNSFTPNLMLRSVDSRCSQFHDYV